MSQTSRIIFHVDFDAFYVSVEMRENPALRGLPVVVGADPEGGKARGVVVACSYEARGFGLHSGMPISQAYRLCPQAVYMRPNFDLYERVSEEVMETLKGHADQFEQVGIDEAFLDVSRKVATAAEAEALALELKKTVREAHHLTCSVGIAPNKSSAKIASDRKKPDGLTLVPFDGVEDFLKPLGVSVVPGIGRKTQEFLNSKGIETIGQLQAIEGRQLVRWFGKNGVWLWGVVHGKENIEVRQQTLPRSLSVERTFKQDLLDFQAVRREARSAASELIGRIRSQHLSYRTGGIKIRFQGFETHTREKSFVSHTESEETLQSIVESLLNEFENAARPVRLVGVRVADLRRMDSESSSLDDWAAS
ncbi:MAG TPA: DNA polymerase IV [Nitrososphaerales archaeon]|nr:DNA polymerase IV [Nitrososphaerales archaeon]